MLMPSTNNSNERFLKHLNHKENVYDEFKKVIYEENCTDDE